LLLQSDFFLLTSTLCRHSVLAPRFDAIERIPERLGRDLSGGGVLTVAGVPMLELSQAIG